MEKIILSCKNRQARENDAVYFYGWLMSKVSEPFAQKLHKTGVNPLAIYAKEENKTIDFVINMLTEEAIQEVKSILLDDNLTEFELISSKQKKFEIQKKNIQTLTEKDLAKIFYQEDADNRSIINLVTPMAFKSNGEYINLPDIRLFFQSLMKKYNSIFEKSEHVDLELLDEICKHVHLIDFKIRSRRYYIHQSFIGGFKGRLVFLCKGNQTLKNYVKTLLIFGQYAGVGIKTSLGMGAIELEEREKKDER